MFYHTKTQLTSLYIATAAAITSTLLLPLSSNSYVTAAFQSSPPCAKTSFHRPVTSFVVDPNTLNFKNYYSPNYIQIPTQRPQHRLFFSSRNNNNNNDKEEEEESFFSKAAQKIKSILPFQKKEPPSSKSQIIQQQTQDSINSLFKDAPLGLRVMSKFISPILSSVAGSLSQAMEEQSRLVGNVLQDAKLYILQNEVVVRELGGGEPISVDDPFSQSSSTMNVNGQSRSMVQARFSVRGRLGNGIATMEATNGKISSLVVNVNGRNIVIDTSGGFRNSSQSSSSRIGKNSNIGKDDIIDAEFVEKVKK